MKQDNWGALNYGMAMLKEEEGEEDIIANMKTHTRTHVRVTEVPK